MVINGTYTRQALKGIKNTKQAKLRKRTDNMAILKADPKRYNANHNMGVLAVGVESSKRYRFSTY